MGDRGREETIMGEKGEGEEINHTLISNFRDSGVSVFR